VLLSRKRAGGLDRPADAAGVRQGAEQRFVEQFGASSFPQYEIVLERVGADGEVVAVSLEVEQDAGTLIDGPEMPSKRTEISPLRKSATSLATV
jgi:hypothetical protein